MENNMSTADFEKALISTLSADLDKKQISSITKAIVGAGPRAYLMDWRWKGMPGFWDVIKVNYLVPIDKFKPDDFFGKNEFNEWYVFRKGTPVPRFMEVQGIIRRSQRDVQAF